MGILTTHECVQKNLSVCGCVGGCVCMGVCARILWSCLYVCLCVCKTAERVKVPISAFITFFISFSFLSLSLSFSLSPPLSHSHAHYLSLTRTHSLSHRLISFVLEMASVTDNRRTVPFQWYQYFFHSHPLIWAIQFFTLLFIFGEWEKVNQRTWSSSSWRDWKREQAKMISTTQAISFFKYKNQFWYRFFIGNSPFTNCSCLTSLNWLKRIIRELESFLDWKCPKCNKKNT